MGSMAPTALFAEPVAQVRVAIDRLARAELALVRAAGLGGDVPARRWRIELSGAAYSRRLERFGRNQGYVPSGYCSASGWLNDECRMTRGTAWERVRQARRLGRAARHLEGLRRRRGQPSRSVARPCVTRNRSWWRRPEG